MCGLPAYLREAQKCYHRISRLQGSSSRERPSALAGPPRTLGLPRSEREHAAIQPGMSASNPSPTNREGAVQRTESVAPTPAPIPLSMILLAAFVVHLPL